MNAAHVCMWQSLLALRRNLHRNPALVEILRRCWSARLVVGLEAPGPVGVVCRHLHSLGWSWHEFEYIDLGVEGGCLS